MKRFIVLFLDAVAATGGAIVKELTSDKLTQLTQNYKDQWAKVISFTDPFTDDAKNAKMALWKIEGEIKAEKDALQRAENEAQLQQKRNERLALNTTMLDAHAALLAEKSKKAPDTAKVAELETAFNTAKEAVDNELLAKYAASSPAKKAAATDGTPADSANKAAIIEMFLAGKSHKEIEDAGYARSTVWHTIDKYKKANNLK